MLNLKFKNDTQKIMFEVTASLIPAVLYKVFVFGWLGLFSLMTLLATALIAERLLSKALKIKHDLADFTAAITAILLFLALNCNMHAFVYFTASFIAIGLAKAVYGGFAKNIFNPAMVGWCFVMLSFPQYMTKHLEFSNNINFVESLNIFFTFYNIDALTQATPLTEFKVNDVFSISNPIFTTNMLILAGGVYILIRNIINFVFPTMFTLGLIAALVVFNYDLYKGFEMFVFYGPMILGAFYIITDPVSSPSLKHAQALYSFAIAFIAVLIAKLGAYPIGLAFAVIFMNSFNFILDKTFATRKQ